MFGSVLGIGLGGVVATQLGWRWAFWAMAFFGIALVVLYRLVVTEQRLATIRGSVPAHAAATASRPRFSTLLPGLFSSRSVVCAYVGSGVQLLVTASLLAWLPSYLNRYNAMAADRAGGAAAVFVLVSGVGMVVCGICTDRYSRNRPRRKLAVAIAYCVASFSLLSTAYLLPAGRPQLVLLGAGMFFAGGTLGPAGAMVANLTHASIHATAFATLTLANNLLGLAPGPVVTGMLADRIGLLGGLQIVAFACLVSAAAFAVAIRHYDADLARVRGLANLQAADAVRSSN
jgi:MFS family permease